MSRQGSCRKMVQFVVYPGEEQRRGLTAAGAPTARRCRASRQVTYHQTGKSQDKEASKMATRVLTGVLAPKAGFEGGGTAVILFNPPAVFGDASGLELNASGAAGAYTA